MTNLNLAGLVLTILFVALILTKKDKLIKDYFLAFFIFLLGTFLLIKYVFELNLFKQYPIIIYLDIYYWVLLGPTLFLYTSLSTKGENHLSKKHLLTLIPAFIVTLCFSDFILFNPIALFDGQREFYLYEIIGIYIWLYNSPIFYILTIILLYKHQKNIKNHFSYTKEVDLKWLFYLSHGFALFLFFLMIQFTARNLFGYNIAIDNYPISIVVTTAYIFGIGFFGYKQRGVFDNVKEPVDREIKSISTVHLNKTAKSLNVQYEKSGLSEDEGNQLLIKLKDLMEQGKPYLDCELDLPALAKMMDISVHKLSQLINEYLTKNFFDFVNEYRVERVKQLLTDKNYNHLKILAIAYESGFNSKSTFYSAFKKFENITPAEYRLRTQKKVV